MQPCTLGDLLLYMSLDMCRSVKVLLGLLETRMRDIPVCLCRGPERASLVRRQSILRDQENESLIGRYNVVWSAMLKPKHTTLVRTTRITHCVRRLNKAAAAAAAAPHLGLYGLWLFMANYTALFAAVLFPFV